MTAESKYFQFPISMLRCQRPSGEPWTHSSDLCQHIIDVAVGDLAASIYGHIDEEVVIEMVERHCIRCDKPEPSAKHIEMVAAGEFLGVRFARSQTLNQSCEQIRKTAKHYPRIGTQCRLRTDILWSMHNDWPLLKTRFLIAVYAGIGQDQTHWLTRSRLRMLAGGFSGMAEFEQAGRPALPTEKQCRHWVNKLWEQDFFQMVLDGNRSIYSNKFRNDRALQDHVRKVSDRQQSHKQIYRI